MGIQCTSTPVLIVGGGPTGLVASILLSSLDIPHILIEKRAEPQKAPAAHVINRRTLEILRQCGMPMENIYRLDNHGTAPLVIRWGANLHSPTLGRLTADTGQDAIATQGAYSRERLVNISQPLLVDALATRAENDEHGCIRYGHEWMRFPDGDTACSEVTDAEGKVYRVQAAYILAADGAGSPIRRALDIGKRGPDHVATFLSLSCAVDKSQVGGDSHTLLDWCLEPELSGVTITHDPEKLTVYMRPLHEPYESLDDYDDATCRTLLTHLFGSNVPFTVLHKGVWRMTAQVAKRFRKDNVFLIGDAAHRFPPTGGLGLNSGVADAHNLVWKIAAHYKREAPDALLDSYEDERRPVVQRNCDVSLANFLKMDEVIVAIGLDPAKAPLPARILAAPLIRSLPYAVKAALLALFTTPVTKLLARAGADTPQGATARAKIQRAVDNQREHFEMPGLELGYVYRNGCAVSHDAANTPENTVVDYAATTLPGARFPHVALSDTDRKPSTLDHFSYAGYTLVHNGSVDDSPCRETFGVPVHTFDIGSVQPEHADSSLSDRLDLPEGGWVLVRPDGHVAARSPHTAS